MNVQRTWTLGLFIVVLLPGVLPAQESKSSSSWWPWSSTSSKPESETRSSSFFGSSDKKSSSESKFKLPSWPKSKPSNKLKTGSNSQSTFSKMGKSTKKFMSDSADFLNPFNDSKPSATKAHGNQSNYWNDRNKPKEEKKGMFDWMWVEEKKDEPPQSMDDFLRGSRPTF